MNPDITRTMNEPGNIMELLDERISFCRSFLRAQESHPNPGVTDQQVRDFTASLNQLTGLRELGLHIIRDMATAGERQAFKAGAENVIKGMLELLEPQLSGMEATEAGFYTMQSIKALHAIREQL